MPKIITTKRKPTSREKGMMELAAKQANGSEFPVFRHGAVLVKGGSVLSLGVNKNQFHSFAAKFKKVPRHATIHAELSCLLAAGGESAAGSTMYVVRINPQGEWRMSKPCCMCQAAMKHVGVKKVIYSVDSNHVGEMKI